MYGRFCRAHFNYILCINIMQPRTVLKYLCTARTLELEWT